MPPEQPKTVILMVLDGWGITQPGPGNAVSLAKIVNFKRLWNSFPHTQLIASGEAVGLPRDEAGNTETGHLNLGAGRIVYQDLERINMSIADGSFFDNSTINEAIDHASKYRSNLHLMGLIGAAGIHSNIEHLFALMRFCKNKNFSRVCLHLIADGRDSPPTSSQTYVNMVKNVIEKEKIGTIASIMGRYWAMDRDRRWDRTERAYNALVLGTGQLVKTPEEAIKMSYANGTTDEFIEPSIITSADGVPISLVSDNDSLIFYNFRVDRPRQLTSAFIVEDFSDTSLSLDFDPYLERYEKTHIPSKVVGYQKVFARQKKLKNLYFATMTEYSKTLVGAGAKAIFPPDRVDMPIGRVLSENGLRQLRVAESEKERFVTYYFNGQRETPFPEEDRIIVPSPNVATYDLKPEMSAQETTQKLLSALKSSQNYSFALINYANPDMVGHTGNIGPAVAACEAVDECLGKVANYILAFGGTLLVTSDHGNVEEMINAHTGQIDTEHNGNPVPFIAVSKDFLGKSMQLEQGILADVATTALSILGITQPSSMTGKNLLKNLEII